MNWLKNNIVNILITIVTIILGIGAVYASLQLKRIAATKAKPTKSAEAQEVCMAMFTLEFGPTPGSMELLPTVTTSSAFPTESTPSATPAATATPTTQLDFEISPTKVGIIN